MPEFSINAHSEINVVSIETKRKPLLNKNYSVITIKIDNIVRIEISVGGAVSLYDSDGIIDKCW